MTVKIDWKNKIVPKVRDILQDRRSRGIPKATVRGIFYILVSLNLIPNIKGPYKNLSRALVKARERGIIPDDWIADESRRIIDIDDEYNSPEDLIDDELEYFDGLSEDYKGQIPRWYKQPAYVEIWVEKAGIAHVFKAILDPVDGTHKERSIIPNYGWTSRTYWINNANRLIRRTMFYHDNVVVLYFGDYDPSGSKMVKKLKKMLDEHGIAFEAVAVTKKQIRQFRLQHLMNTDPAVLAKLKNDNNRFEFMRENDGQLFQIELDALEALRPDDLRDLLLKSVDDLFDENVYEEVMNDLKHQPEEIRRLVIKKLIAYARKLQRQRQQ